MPRKPFISIILVTIVVVVVTSFLTWVRAAQAQSKAFTIKYIQKAGTTQTQTTEVYYSRRSNGSVVESRMMPAPDHHLYAQRILRDASLAVKITIDDATESITSYPMAARSVAALQHPSLDCAADPNGTESTILGYKTVKKTLQVPSPEGRRIETWFAPDLSCAVLRELTFGNDNNGNAVQLASKEAVSVALGEPDPVLFVAPKWQERAPSEVMAEFGRRYHLDAPLSSNHPNQLDNAYKAAHSSQPQQD